MGHRLGRRRAMPVLLAGRKPHDIAGPDFLDRPALALHPAKAGRHDQGLPERMAMPGGSRAGIEGDVRTAPTGGIRGFEQRIDADAAGEIIRRPFARGLRAVSSYFHGGKTSLVGGEPVSMRRRVIINPITLACNVGSVAARNARSLPLTPRPAADRGTCPA